MNELFEVKPQTALLWGCISGLMTTGMYLGMVYPNVMEFYVDIASLTIIVVVGLIAMLIFQEVLILLIQAKYYATKKTLAFNSVLWTLLRWKVLRKWNLS